MSIAALLGVAAAGLTGYQRGKNEADDREAERLRQQQEAQLRDANIQSAQLELQRKQQDVNDQALIRGAGMNVSPESSDAGPMPEGQAYRVAGQGFADASQAQAAATAMNTPEAKTAKLLGVMRQIDPVKAIDFEKANIGLTKDQHALADELHKNGFNHLYTANMSARPSEADLTSGTAPSTFDLKGVDEFNKTGDYKIPQGSKGKWVVQTLPSGQKVVDAVVVGPDGSQVHESSMNQLADLYNRSYDERQKAYDQQFRDGAQIAYNKGMLGVAQQNSATMERDRRDRARALFQKNGLFDRMDEIDKLRLQSVQSQIARLDAEMAKDTWNPDSPGGIHAKESMARLTDQLNKIISSYDPKAAGQSTDLGLTRGDSEQPVVKPSSAAPTKGVELNPPEKSINEKVRDLRSAMPSSHVEALRRAQKTAGMGLPTAESLAARTDQLRNRVSSSGVVGLTADDLAALRVLNQIK